MRQAHILISIASAFATLAFGACQGTTRTEEVPFAPSAWQLDGSREPIAPDTVAALREVAVIDDGAGQGPVLAIGVTREEADVLVLTGGDGHLRRYDGSTGSLEDDFALGVVIAGAPSFDKSADFMLGARLESDNAATPAPATVIGDIAVWDTSTGDLLRCIDLTCSEGSRWPPAYSGASLDPTGTKALTFSDLAYTTSYLSNGGSVNIYVVNEPDSPVRDRLAEAVFDQTGRRVALAFVSGNVEVRGGPPLGRMEMGYDDSQVVSDLSFSPDGDYLARVSDSRLTVWRLDLIRGSIVVDTAIPKGRALYWSPDNRLLFVCAGDKILVWDVDTWTEAGGFQAPSVETAIVSPDATLLFWGDTEGTVHVVAVHESSP